jgi:acid phosphatase (class A)
MPCYKIIRNNVPGLLIAGLLSGCAAAGHVPRCPWKVSSTKEFVATTPPPPARNSPAMRQGLREILAMQAGATPEKIASARWTYEFSVFTFSLALGPSFTAEKYPATARLFGKLNALVARVNGGVKDYYRSPHPFQVDSRVKRFVIAVPGFDYPSFHSARCAVFERVLAMLDASRTREFQASSARIEQDRVFAGEHFPYSIVAGRRLGEMIFKELMQDPNFRADVAALKSSEWTPPPDSRNSFQVGGNPTP